MYRRRRPARPDSYLALARAVFAEMALAGVTASASSTTCTTDRAARRYDDPNAMGHALSQAAARGRDPADAAGHLLPRGRTDGRRPRRWTVQLRFSDGTSTPGRRGSPPCGPRCRSSRVGAAVHSVRAVRADRARRVAEASPGGPLHAHLSEQPAENAPATRPTGSRRPRCWPRPACSAAATTAVHATHLTDADIALLGRQRHHGVLLPDHRARPRRRDRPGPARCATPAAR